MGFIKVMIIAGTIISIYGIAQHLGFEFPHFHHPLIKNSTFGNPNFAGHYLAGIIPLSLCLKKKWLIPVCILLTYLIIIGSRAALVGLTGAIAIMLIRHFRRKAIIPLVILMAASPLLFKLDLQSQTINQRATIWRSTLNMIKDNPFGVGIGNFSLIYPKYQTPEALKACGSGDHFIRQAHSEPLQLIAEVSLFGLIAFLWVVFKPLRLLWRKKDKISLALTGSITACLIASVFSFNLQNEASALCFWFGLGLSGVLLNENNKILYSNSGNSCPA